MQRYTDILGEIVKSARIRSGLTIEAVSEQVGITERYLYRIENEGQKPSFDVLYKLIRLLSIPADSIFYPEKVQADLEAEAFLHMLYRCDARSKHIVCATLNAVLESQDATQGT